VILVDTSGLLAALDESQRHHRECATLLQEASPPLLLSPFVLAELDYLLMRHMGHHAQAALLEEVARGAYQLEGFAAADIARAKQVIEICGPANRARRHLARGAGRDSCPGCSRSTSDTFRAMRAGGHKRFQVLPFDRRTG
jgi:predicted nucleic acid-binding protein